MTRIIIVLASATLLAFSSACGDDDDHNGHNNDHHHVHIDRLEVVDRGQTDRPTVATWTVEDGWTAGSELPRIPRGERISLGVRALCEDGDDIIAEDDHYEARYALAPGAPTGIIDTGRDNIFHGDHVHIYGIEEGSTQIELLVWHGDHSDLETDPIDVFVDVISVD